MLIKLDEIADADAENERMRLALLTAKPDLVRALYPEYFSSEDPGLTEEIVEAGPDLDLNRDDTAYDFSKVEFEMPSEEDPEFDMLQRMLGNAEVTVSGPIEPPEGLEGDHEART